MPTRSLNVTSIFLSRIQFVDEERKPTTNEDSDKHYTGCNFDEHVPFLLTLENPDNNNNVVYNIILQYDNVIGFKEVFKKTKELYNFTPQLDYIRLISPQHTIQFEYMLANDEISKLSKIIVPTQTLEKLDNLKGLARVKKDQINKVENIRKQDLDLNKKLNDLPKDEVDIRLKLQQELKTIEITFAQEVIKVNELIKQYIILEQEFYKDR